LESLENDERKGTKGFKMKVTKDQLEKMVDAVLDHKEIKRGSKYLPHVRRKQETLTRQIILIALCAIGIGTPPPKL